MEESWNTLGLCKCTFNHLKKCLLAKGSYQHLQVALQAVQLHRSNNWGELAPLLAAGAKGCRLTNPGGWVLSNSWALWAVWVRNPGGGSAGGCASSSHSRVRAEGLRHISPALVFQCGALGSAGDPGTQKHLLQTLSLCLRQAHALRAAAAKQRSEFSHPAPRWNSVLQDATELMEAPAHSWWIGLFRAGSEKRGSPRPAELEADGWSRGGLFCPSSVSVTAAVADSLQRCVDFNKPVHGFLASLLYISNPSANSVGLWQ